MSAVNLLDLHGEPVNVSQEDVQSALNAGYKVPSPDQIAEFQKQQQFGTGLGNELKAFGEGAARAASFGTSDYLLPKLPGGPTTKALSERQKRNQIPSTLGGVTGIVTSALLPGGGLIGGASKLAGMAADTAAPIIGNAIANRTAAAALSKIGSTAIGSGVLGSFFGTGNVVSEAALGDPELNAQKAWTQIGMSTLLAGGVGAGLSAIGLGFPKAIELAKSASKLAEAGETQASELSPDLLEASQKLLADHSNAISSITEDSHSSGLVKALSKYALGAAKMALPHGVTVAMDVGASLLKAEALAGIEEMAQKTTQAISKAGTSIFNVASEGVPFASALTVKKLTDNYDKVVKQVEELSDPNVFMNKMDEATKSIYPHAPQISGHLQMTMASATQFLNSKIPKPAVQAPLSAPFVPSDSQKEEFLHYFNVVNNPLIALNEIKRGNLTKETMEALTSVHAKLYQDMRQSLMGKLMEVQGKKKDIPYQTKAMLTQFFKEPLDESFMPSSIMATQGIFMGPQKSNQGMGLGNTKSGGHGLSGLSKLNVASRARLGTQKVNLGQKL